MSRLNEYSSGGFDYLVEHLETKPHTVEEFLQNYVKLLQSVVDDSSTWKQFLGTTGRTSKKSR
jgi:hypothetical protein